MIHDSLWVARVARCQKKLKEEGGKGEVRASLMRRVRGRRREGGATVCEYESEEWEKEEREEAEVRKRFSANEKHAISLCRFKAFLSTDQLRSSILLSKVKLADLSEK